MLDVLDSAVSACTRARTRAQSFYANVALILLLIVHILCDNMLLVTQTPCNYCAQVVGVWHGFGGSPLRLFVGFARTQHNVLCIVKRTEVCRSHRYRPGSAPQQRIRNNTRSSDGFPSFVFVAQGFGYLTKSAVHQVLRLVDSHGPTDDKALGERAGL
jgi:hypothetical protein